MVCQVCGKEQRWSDVVAALLVRDSIVETIQTTPARGFDRGHGGGMLFGPGNSCH
jgi:hypothetical protein